MMSRHYRVVCQACGGVQADDGYMLACPSGCASLLRSQYAPAFTPDSRERGVFRYRSWLPVESAPAGAGESIVYHARELGDRIGLQHLYVAFNGWWPERGATLPTATFKDLEAATVCARMPRGEDRALVLASAGNTAAAFARICTVFEHPCVIVVPADVVPTLRFSEPVSPRVRVVALVDGADYDDAIAFARRLGQCEGFVLEGGVRNIARRDGMGTTMLRAVETMGRLPDAYVQAVGSGAGAIAAHEAARRLIAGANVGTRFPRLVLSQNYPFVPMYHAWLTGSATVAWVDRPTARRQIARIAAPVLSNQDPPYALAGGVRACLTESGGTMLVADNHEAADAADLFAAVEDVDIEPPAAVALAALIKAVQLNALDSEEFVLLNVTGGGRAGLARSAAYGVEPALAFSAADALGEAALAEAAGMFALA